MSNVFGPESTNPRHRRAYAHALRAKAAQSGKPEDKLDALVAANRASHTVKGRQLGLQTLQAIIKNYERPGMFNDIPSQDVTWGDKVTSWDNKYYADRYQAACKAIGETAGVILIKPETRDGYLAAALETGSGRCTTLEERAELAQQNQEYLKVLDFSVPGTAFIHDAAIFALATADGQV